ncbi:hypothetical protein GGI09_002953 [Coemansia sp. S100]|nr:hypothetical protein GGI09_002953 [Coemansia sp. S100]
MKEHPLPPPLPPKDVATTPLLEKQQQHPPAVFFNRSSPTPLASTIAQRRLQRKPMGLQLDAAPGSPLAGLIPLPPATATGTWAQKTPGAIPDAQHSNRHHDSPSRRLPPIGSNGSSSRLARAAATPGLTTGAPVPAAGGDTQESLKSFQEAVNASSLSSSFTLRPSLLGTAAVSHSPKLEMRRQPSNRPSSRQQQQQQKRVSGLDYLGSAVLASKLGDRATGATNNGGVVIDMRKSADYNNSHIRSAIGMTVPTTLVKRTNFPVQRLLAMLHVPEEQKQQLACWKQGPWVVIYGEGIPEETASEDAQLVLLARKFMSEAPDTCCVYVLEGGYAEFSRVHPALCEFSVAPSAEPLPAPSLPAIATAPRGDKPTMDLDNNMLRKMRQTPGGGFDPNEVISMRMPPEFAALKALSTPPGAAMAPLELAVRDGSLAAPLTPRGFASLGEMQLKVLPAYLRLVADPDTGPAVLMKLFKNLDTAEYSRMKTMIENRGVVTEVNQFTISAGIELGTKNRYDNILPFDRTRVKLQRRWSRPAAESCAADKGKAVVGGGSNVNKPLPPLPPGTPLGAVGGITPLMTPVGGISGSAAHLRLRMQGDRPVSYDHSVAIAGTPTQPVPPLFGGVGASGSQQLSMLMAKRSSQRVEISRKGKGSLTGDYDDGDAHRAVVDMDSEAAVLWSAMSAGAGAGGGSSETDYINASYLSYFGGPLYIATQGPMPATMRDFWHMVWEHKSRVVVMLTRSTEYGRAKCHQYWPTTPGSSETYGDIEVVFEAEAPHPDDHSVVARRLKLTNGGASVAVTHLQYLGWPDHGVPENPLGVLRLRQLAHRAQTETELAEGRQVPMVVHCSAGCGRTGAFCAIDTLLSLAETQSPAVDADGDVSMSDNGAQQSCVGPVPPALRSDSNSSLDSNSGGQSLGGWVEKPPAELRDNLVFMVVARFREQRMMSVQTGRQFAFCHETLVWALLGVGPRPLERAIDRRLVAEWNRANHPGLSLKDCTDITYLMRGRCEMVSAMQSAAAAEEECVAASSRASVDIGGSPSVMAPPMIKRSNTVGAARRGLFGSMFRPSGDKAVSSPGVAATAAAAAGEDTRQLRELELVSSVIMANNEQLSAVAEEELSGGSAERPLPPFPTCGAEALDAGNDYFGNVPSGASDNLSSGGSFHHESLSAGNGHAQTPAAAEWRRNMLGHYLEPGEYVHSPHAHLSHQLHLHGGSNSNTPLASPSALASPRVK